MSSSSWRPVPTFLNVILSNSYPLCYPFVYAVVYIYIVGAKNPLPKLLTKTFGFTSLPDEIIISSGRYIG